jgi:hypothetical protein
LNTKAIDSSNKAREKATTIAPFRESVIFIAGSCNELRRYDFVTILGIASDCVGLVAFP